MPVFIVPLVGWVIAKAVAYRIAIAALAVTLLTAMVGVQTYIAPTLHDLVATNASPELASLLCRFGIFDYISIVTTALPFAVFITAVRFSKLLVGGLKL